MKPDAVVLSRATPPRSAEAFLKEYKQHLIHFQSEWFVWNGSAYYTIENDTIEMAVAKFLRRAKVRQQVEDSDGETSAELKPFNPKRNDINEVATALKHLCHRDGAQSLPPCWLDDGQDRPDPKSLISCLNVLVDIETGETYDQTPDFFTRTALPIDYDVDAPAPERWLQFINEVTEGHDEMFGPDVGLPEPELAAALQEVAGYLLTLDTSQQRVFFPIGPRRSGKGTFLRILTALVGSNNVANPSIESLAGMFGMQSLPGKSVIIIGDANCSERTKLATAANRINGISGEDAQQVDRKNMGSINVRLNTRVVIAANHLPDFGIHASAMAARLLFLPFLNSFYGREDRSLEKKLLPELAGILLWALAGLKRLRERGTFTEPKICRNEKTRMLRLSNPVRTFVEDRCELHADKESLKSALYFAYTTYCAEFGRSPLSLDKFAEQLYELGREQSRPITDIRLTVGTQRPRAFRGIALLPRSVTGPTTAPEFAAEPLPDDELASSDAAD